MVQHRLYTHNRGTHTTEHPLNTPGTKKKKRKNALHISSSYAKILGETNFQPREIPRSGSKAKDGERERRRRERERLNDGNNNGQLRIATPAKVRGVVILKNENLASQ